MHVMYALLNLLSIGPYSSAHVFVYWTHGNLFQSNLYQNESFVGQYIFPNGNNFDAAKTWQHYFENFIRTVNVDGPYEKSMEI